MRFGALDRSDVARIVRLELAKVARSLKEQEISLEVSDEAVAWLAERGLIRCLGLGRSSASSSVRCRIGWRISF